MAKNINNKLLKTIALLDLYTGGHRDAFMCLFTKACLENNAKVICIYPNSQIIKDWLLANAEIPLDNIIFIDFTPIHKSYKSFGRFNNALSVLAYWKFCSSFLRKIEIENNVKIDIVYFNWLDSQMANYLPASILDYIFPYKWSGLYFHPVIFRRKLEYLNNKVSFKDVDSIYSSKNCVAVTIHDEGILEKYKNRINKKTILFPEIADAAPPNPVLPLSIKIKNQANGRIIVGLIGLEPYKGTLNLIRLARMADTSKFFFAFTGYYQDSYLDTLSENDKKEYLNFVSNLPENCLWQTGGLKEGEEYNSVFCSFDIIHIVYKDFYSSSNRLTKAAIFNKLVLASDNGCVGDDVPKYKLGEIANQDNVLEQYEKLQILRNKILAKDFPYDQWKIYAEKHSTNRLREKFEELFTLI